MIRIFSLSVYALKVTTDPEAWEEFHSVAGEIMFLPWLFIFLLVVTVIETKRLKRLDSEKQETMKHIVHDYVITASTAAMTSSIPPSHDIIISGNA